MKSLATQLYLERHKIQYLNNPETWLNNKKYERYLDINTAETSIKRKDL